MSTQIKTRLNTTSIAAIILIISTIVFFVAKAQTTNKEKTLLAGASISNITPANSSEYMKNRQLHDSLFVRTLVLDDGINRIALIVVDNQGVPGYIIDQAKIKILQNENIQPSNIIVSSTHSHSTIFAGNPINLRKTQDPFDDYQKLLIDRISESVTAAVNNLEPATIGWDSFDKPEHVFNRRWYMRNLVLNPFGFTDSVKTNPGSADLPDLIKPAGPVDPEVSFIAVKSLSDEPIAIFANYSLHYVGVPEKDISSDYYGEFSDYLSKILEPTMTPPFVGIMSNGTSGDINNINYRHKDTLQHYKKIDIVAHDIADEISDRFEHIEFKNWIPLKTASESIQLNLRKPTKKMKANIERVTLNKQKNLVFNDQEKKYATRANNFEKLFPDKITITVQVIRIGDLVIGAVPFEVFAETGLLLKNKSPFKNTFIIGIANGHWGYLPTPEQHKKGGYESWFTVNRVQEDASDIIVNELLSLFNKVK